MEQSLKQMRTAVGISASRMARYLGTTEKTIYNVEHDEWPKPVYVLAYERVLEIVAETGDTGHRQPRNKPSVSTGELTLFGQDVIDLRTPTDHYLTDTLPWVSASMPVAS